MRERERERERENNKNFIENNIRRKKLKYIYILQKIPNYLSHVCALLKTYFGSHGQSKMASKTKFKTLVATTPSHSHLVSNSYVKVFQQHLHLFPHIPINKPTSFQQFHAQKSKKLSSLSLSVWKFFRNSFSPFFFRKPLSKQKFQSSFPPFLHLQNLKWVSLYEMGQLLHSYYLFPFSIFLVNIILYIKMSLLFIVSLYSCI